MNNFPPPLAEQLALASGAVGAVMKGRSLTEALAQVAAPLRPGVQALAFHALRHWGEAQVLTRLLVERAPAAPVSALLGLALTLLLTEEPGELAYAPHTVVDQAVQAVGRLKVRGHAAGFVNACLRRFLRERQVLLARAAEDAEARWNHPFWWVQRVRRDHPQHWQALLRASQQAAPMVLRVNRLRCSQSDYLQRVQALGWQAWPLLDDGVVLDRAHPVHDLPGWDVGWVSVQDGAAQLAAPLLLGESLGAFGGRVLDACAAPGGKTAHLLERGASEVWALEVDPVRAQRIGENLSRLGLAARVKVADAGDLECWWDGEPFDAILLDAPCTASGIGRRHPDVRWLRRPSDVEQLVQAQRRLLEALWPLLKPGGRLLYCTCSVFRAEGEGQMAAFAQRHPEAVRLPAPGHIYPGETPLVASTAWPLNDNVVRGFDSFYYALWRKPEA